MASSRDVRVLAGELAAVLGVPVEAVHSALAGALLDMLRGTADASRASLLRYLRECEVRDLARVAGSRQDLVLGERVRVRFLLPPEELWRRGWSEEEAAKVRSDFADGIAQVGERAGAGPFRVVSDDGRGGWYEACELELHPVATLARVLARYAGKRVRVDPQLEADRRGYDAESVEQRRGRGGSEGEVVDHQTGHGLCFRVKHENGSAWYEPDELEILEG